MKNISIALLTIFCFGCKQNVKSKQESRYAELLKLYKITTIDTLKVFAANNPDSAGYEFKGIKLDTASISLLPKQMLKDTVPIYAVYKFAIDSLKTGLITRTPGNNQSSSIKLLIYDKQKDSITDYVELADLPGAGPDAIAKTSWVYKDGNKDAVCFLKEEIYRDNSIEDPKDTVQTKTSRYYSLGFKKTIHDTLDKNAVSLLATFKQKD
ncbi:hypothetical protein BH09BAC6_BH09BAC6_10230 [soil metagenome]|jgi:hypothetical protein